MKIKILNLILLPALCLFSACQLAQFEASAVYVGAEAATAAILQKHPGDLATLQLLSADWSKFQGGTLTTGDEASLLKTIVSATNQSLTPTEAAVLDGATQQFLANQNNTAPTPLGGAAAAILTDLMNGVSRGIVIYQTPPAS
jgi:hypothetical protein